MAISSLLRALRGRGSPSDELHNVPYQANTSKLTTRLKDVFLRTWDLGFTSFGGPPVHFQIFHSRFVDCPVPWIDEQTYQELFAICQALPGPGSTKMEFCIALVHAGFVPALGVFFMWSLPGALGMYALALGINNVATILPGIVYAFLSGLNSATVGIIALAAVQLAEKAITDQVSRGLVVFGAAAGLCYNALWYFPVLIVFGGFVTVGWDMWGRGLHGRWRERRERRKREKEARSGADADREGLPINEIGRGDQQQANDNTATTGVAGAGTSTTGTIGTSNIVQQRRGGASSAASSNRNDTITATTTNDRSSCNSTTNTEDIQIIIPTSSAPSATLAQQETALANQKETEKTPSVHSWPRAANTSSMLSHAIPVKTGLFIIAFFFISFITILTLRSTLPSPPLPLSLFANMYLAGTVIFGGGPVVIPLLREYVVEPGWVSSRDFLLGLAIIQAFPGPNFNFAVYLGALALLTTQKATAAESLLGAFLGFLGIFFPGITLAIGFQALWRALRSKPWVIALLRGINATAVGLVFTAVYRLWEIGYLNEEVSRGMSLGREPWWVVVASVTFAAVRWFGCPPPVGIVSGGLAGLVWWGVVSS